MGVSLNKDDGQRHTLFNNQAVAKEHAMSDANTKVIETLFAEVPAAPSKVRVSEKRDPIPVPEGYMGWFRVIARNALDDGEEMAKLIEVVRNADGTVADATPRKVGDATIRHEMVVLESDFRAAVGNLIEIAIDGAQLDRVAYVSAKGKTRTIRLHGEISAFELSHKQQRAAEMEALIAKNPEKFAAFRRQRAAALKAAAKPAASNPAEDDVPPIL